MGKRKGFNLDLDRRNKTKLTLPKHVNQPKYSEVPHPLLKLDRNALPKEASEDDYNRAVKNFSWSVTKKVQSNYSTAVRHYLAAECSLGRKFSLPPCNFSARKVHQPCHCTSTICH